MNSLHRIQPLLDRQLGLITRRQLMTHSFTKREIDRLIGQRWLTRVHGGVYSVAGSARSYEQRLMAGCLVNGRGSIVTHRGACHLWNIDLGAPPVVELTAPRSSSARTPGVIVHRPARIHHRHTVELGPFAVTTPARTVADLGAVVPEATVASAMEQVLRRRLASTAYLDHLCDELEHPWRKGPPVLRSVLRSRLVGAAPSDSDIELDLARICRDFGVPMPVFQFELVIDGEKKRIDFAFPHLQVAIEVDGWNEHMKYAKFQGDRVRRNELELLGWVVLNFTWHQIKNDPAYVASTIRRAFDLASDLAVGA